MNFPLKYDVHPPNVGFNDPTFDGTKWCLTGATFLGYPVPLCEAKKKVGILICVNGLMTIPPKWLSNLSLHTSKQYYGTNVDLKKMP